MSMLYYFFSNKENENARLFDGVKTSENAEIMCHKNQYPVIFLTRKNMKDQDFKQQMDYFSLIIANEARKYTELFISTVPLRRCYTSRLNFSQKSGDCSRNHNFQYSLLLCDYLQFFHKTLCLFSNFPSFPDPVSSAECQQGEEVQTVVVVPSRPSPQRRLPEFPHTFLRVRSGCRQ